MREHLKTAPTRVVLLIFVVGYLAACDTDASTSTSPRGGIVVDRAIADTTIEEGSSYRIALGKIVRTLSDTAISFSVVVSGDAVSASVINNDTLLVNSFTVGSSVVSVTADAPEFDPVRLDFTVAVQCSRVIDPTAAESFFPATVGREWVYDYERDYSSTETYSWAGFERTTRGILTWRIESVSSACGSLSFSMSESLRGTVTESLPEDPNGNHPGIDTTYATAEDKVLIGTLSGDLLTIEEYPSVTVSPTDTLRWRYPESSIRYSALFRHRVGGFWLPGMDWGRPKTIYRHC